MLWVVLIILAVLAGLIVIAIAILTSVNEREWSITMARWGVDRQLIDTKEYDEAVAALEELLCSIHAMRDEFEELAKMGIYLSVDGDFCEDLENEVTNIKDQIETAEEKYVDSFEADNTDFM